MHDYVASFITVYVILHFRNTSDENVLSDSLDLFDHIRMPLWPNTRSAGALRWNRQCTDLNMDSILG